jgi:hypothetical protein
MPVGGLNVVDYVNTTLTTARQVIADGAVSGAGVVALYAPGPVTFDYIVTEGGDNISTQVSGDLLITQS